MSPDGASFESAWAHASRFSDMDATNARVVWEQVRRAPEGELWECGTCEGGSAYLMQAASGWGRTLRVFDTFDAFPPPGAEDIPLPQHYHPIPDVEKVKSLLGPGAHLYVGTLPGSLEQAPSDAPIGFIHVDLDLYPGTMGVLRAVWPRMSPGGIILVHDYGNQTWRGVPLAVDEFAAEVDVSLERMPGLHVKMVRPDVA